MQSQRVKLLSLITLVLLSLAAIIGIVLWRAGNKKGGAVPAASAIAVAEVLPSTRAGLRPARTGGARFATTVAVAEAGASSEGTGDESGGKSSGVNSDWEAARAAFRHPVPVASPRAPREHQVVLASGAIVLVEGRRAAIPKRERSARDTHPYIVQADSATGLSGSAAELEAAGARMRGYLPHNAWLVELDDAALERVGALPFVRATFSYEPELRLQPWLAQAGKRFTADTEVTVAIRTFQPEDAPVLARRLRAARAVVLVVMDDISRRGGSVRARVALGLLSDLTSWPEVQWVEEYRQPEPSNELAGMSSHLNTQPTRIMWELDGRGQVVGHADTGLDNGDLETLHPDVRGRVVGEAWSRPGVWSDQHGHGTHTAGSILGDGTMSSGQYVGSAPGARLFHQSIGAQNGALTGLTNLYALLRQSYDGGARIHSDSWGSDENGLYTMDSVEVDEFAWDHPEFLAVFAAGNAGVDGNADGVVDLGSLGSPATAKNIVTVGAAESDRPVSTGGYSGQRYYGRWPLTFTAEPIRSDYITWSADSGPSYRQGMAAFSSRGPTQDGRVKPDVVAPGSDVLSLLSSVASKTMPDSEYPNYYRYNLGTSMATPLVAGAAAVLRQALERQGIAAPTASLLRAMLAGGARSLSPGQYGEGTTREVPATRPNNVEGHGHADLGRTLFPDDGRMALYRDRLEVSEIAPLEIEFEVARGGLPLHVVLAWSDPAATPGAGLVLVNDLDLELDTPGGKVKPATVGLGGTDTVNPMERVDVAAAAAGSYTARIKAARLPDDSPGNFTSAIYISGGLDLAPVLYHEPLPPKVNSDGDPLAVAVSTHYHRGLGAEEIFVRYILTNSTNLPPAEAAWQTNALLNVGMIGGGTRFNGTVPRPSEGEFLHYAIEALGDATGTAAPLEGAYVVEGYVPVEWVVAGDPSDYGMVVPGYGSHEAVPGEMIEAHADPSFPTEPGRRVQSVGYSGTNGIPSGSGSSLSFSLPAASYDTPPTLTWLWEAQVALTLSSIPAGAVERVEWFAENTSGATTKAPEVVWNAQDEPFGLAGWLVDGVRWPGLTGASPNPVAGIVMTLPRTAEAQYLPFWEDADGNGLRDAWEMRWMGAAPAGLVAASDSDGDGWSNLLESLDNTNPLDDQSRPEPPVIADVTIFANPVDEEPPYEVSATITDNLHVAEAVLLWRAVDASQWEAVPMEARGDDVYTASFVPEGFGTVTSEYCVAASDLAGLQYPELRATSAVQRVWASLPYPRLVFEAEPPWLLSGPREVMTQRVEVVNYGSAALDYELHLLGVGARLDQDTTQQANGWILGSTLESSMWQRVTKRKTSGYFSWYCGNTATGEYDNSLYARLRSPTVLVGTNTWLAYDQWIETEFDHDNYYWDGGILQISADDGATWQSLVPEGGYPHRIMPNPASPFQPHQPCFGGRGEGWETIYADLSAYAGQEVSICFVFGSDRYVAAEGWYVDNLRFYDSGHAPNGLALLPTTEDSLEFSQRAPFELRFDPLALGHGIFETEGFVLALHNDPQAGARQPVAGRYGFTVRADARGPGRLSFESTLLFQRAGTSLVATADSYAEVRGVTTNGVTSHPPAFTTQLSLLFTNLVADAVAEIDFGWSLAERGVPLWWLARYGWTNDTAAAVEADADGDGAFNWQEFVANTDPTNALSYLRIESIANVTNGWEIAWRSGPWRTQLVERTSNLGGTNVWLTELLVLPEDAVGYAAGVTNAVDERSFFRIRPLPPDGDAGPH